MFPAEQWTNSGQNQEGFFLSSGKLRLQASLAPSARDVREGLYPISLT